MMMICQRVGGRKDGQTVWRKQEINGLTWWKKPQEAGPVGWNGCGGGDGEVSGWRESLAWYRPLFILAKQSTVTMMKWAMPRISMKATGGKRTFIPTELSLPDSLHQHFHCPSWGKYKSEDIDVFLWRYREICIKQWHIWTKFCCRLKIYLIMMLFGEIWCNFLFV